MKAFAILILPTLLFVGAVTTSLSLNFLPFTAEAQSNSATPGPSNSGTPGLGNSGTPSPGAVRSFTLNNPLNFRTLSDFITAILNAVIKIGIPIAVLFVVWAGFKFVTAQGNPEELKSARKNLVWTLVGIGIFLGAALIAEIIRQTLRTIGVNI